MVPHDLAMLQGSGWEVTKSLIIKIIAHGSVNNRPIFTKVSIFHNLLAQSLDFKPGKSLITKT